MMKLQRNTRTSKPLLIGAAIGIALVVLGLAKLFAPQTVGNLLTTLARPFWEARVNLSSEAAIFRAFQSQTALVRENEELKETLRNAELKLLDRGTLVRENRELKGLLGTGTTTTTNALPAAVLSRPNATPYDTLIIARGSRDGVVVGDRVFAGGSVLLGEIETVFGETARVELYSSPGVETEVALPEREVVATARGEGGGNFTFRIPSDIGVEEGDAVTVAGRATSVLGFVGAREAASGDVFQTVRFRTPVNLSTIRWVLVNSEQL